MDDNARGTPAAEPERYSDQLRRAAAVAQDLQASEARRAESLDRFASFGMDVSWLREHSERQQRFLRQLASVHAAQALAYDEMMAAGGPENSRAYVEYEAATRRNTALLPQDKLGDD